MSLPPSATYKHVLHAGPAPLGVCALIGTNVAVEFTVQSTDGQQMTFSGRSVSLVAYLFPGSATSPMHGSDTPLADAEEHRGFRDLHEQMTALGVVVVGVSSQSVARLQEAVAVNHLSHPLASDPTLRLGELLKLPTFRVGAERLYERLTILLTAGNIAQVFYPVVAPGRHAEEVLEWVTAT